MVACRIPWQQQGVAIKRANFTNLAVYPGQLAFLYSPLTLSSLKHRSWDGTFDVSFITHTGTDLCQQLKGNVTVLCCRKAKIWLSLNLTHLQISESQSTFNVITHSHPEVSFGHLSLMLLLYNNVFFMFQMYVYEYVILWLFYQETTSKLQNREAQEPKKEC